MSAHCWVTGCLWGLQAADPHPAPAHISVGWARFGDKWMCRCDWFTHEFFHSKYGNAKGVGLKRVKYPRTFPEPEGLDKESEAEVPTPEQGTVTEGPQQTEGAALPQHSHESQNHRTAGGGRDPCRPSSPLLASCFAQLNWNLVWFSVWPLLLVLLLCTTKNSGTTQLWFICMNEILSHSSLDRTDPSPAVSPYKRDPPNP